MKMKKIILLLFCGLCLNIWSQTSYTLINKEIFLPNEKEVDLTVNVGYYYRIYGGHNEHLFSSQWLNKCLPYDIRLKDSISLSDIAKDSIFFSVIGTNPANSKNEKIILKLNQYYISGISICGGDIIIGLTDLINDLFVGVDKEMLLADIVTNIQYVSK